jgi:hypothetical protein
MQPKRKRSAAKLPLRKGHVYPVNLNQASEALGCSKHHLAQVLRGNRTSPKLKARYEALTTQFPAA